MSRQHEIDLDPVIPKDEQADLSAQLSGLLDRYTAIMTATGKLDHPGERTIGAVTTITSNLVQEAQARLVTGIEGQEQFELLLLLVQNVVLNACRSIGGLPTALKFIAATRLARAMENGLNSPEPWATPAKQSQP